MKFQISNSVFNIRSLAFPLCSLCSLCPLWLPFSSPSLSRRRIAHGYLGLLLILLNAAGPVNAAQSKDISPLLQSVLAEHHDMPGMVAAIVDGDQVTAIGAAGFRKSGSMAPMKTSDLIHLGSDTKAMTATLIGQ